MMGGTTLEQFGGSTKLTQDAPLHILHALLLCVALNDKLLRGNAISSTTLDILIALVVYLIPQRSLATTTMDVIQGFQETALDKINIPSEYARALTRHG